MFYLSNLTNSMPFLHRLSHMRCDKYLITIYNYTMYEFKLVPIVLKKNKMLGMKYLLSYPNILWTKVTTTRSWEKVS